MSHSAGYVFIILYFRELQQLNARQKPADTGNYKKRPPFIWIQLTLFSYFSRVPQEKSLKAAPMIIVSLVIKQQISRAHALASWISGGDAPAAPAQHLSGGIRASHSVISDRFLSRSRSAIRPISRPFCKFFALCCCCCCGYGYTSTARRIKGASPKPI